ncbi:MAG: DUF1572 family protein [Isosphaeraceae bacterium]
MDSTPLNEPLAQLVLSELAQQLADQADLVRHCVGQLSDEQLWWRPSGGQNSIANLLIHVSGNIGQRFGSVIAGGPDRRDRMGEFADRSGAPRAELIARFDEAVSQAERCLSGLQPAALLEPRTVPMLKGAVERPVFTVALQSVLHLAAHTQEVVFLCRSLLGDQYRPRNPLGFPVQKPAD